MSEEIIGVAGSADDEINIKSAQYARFQCTNCAKRKIHCIAGGKKGDPVEMLKDRCTNPECECRCRTHYIANNGRLRRYGTVDDTSVIEDMDLGITRTHIDDMIDEFNAKIRDNNQ